MIQLKRNKSQHSYIKCRLGATFCPHFLWMTWWIVDRIVDKRKKLLITTRPKKFNVDLERIVCHGILNLVWG